ncbi:MAG: hypothetical protein ACK41Z_10570 [Sediminibacterium sp.]
MKQLINIISFLIFPFFVNGQLHDTIPNEEGTFMIILKTEKERIDSLMKEKDGIFFRANYRIIDSSGTVVEESIFNEFGQNGTVEIKRRNGKKKMEQYILENSILTKHYYESGNLKYENNNHFDKSFGFTETRTYYDNEFNSIESLTIEERIVPAKFEGINIKKWRINEKKLMETIIVEQEIKDSIYIPVREITFYPNGEIKEKGEYSKRRFFEFRNQEFYQKWLIDRKEYIDSYAVILNQRVKLKDGEWNYFDDKGNLIKTENYNDGKLIE